MSDEKRKFVQKKKLIDTLCERNIDTVVEKHVSSKNVATYIYMLVDDEVANSIASYIPIINKQTNLNKPSSKQTLFKK